MSSPDGMRPYSRWSQSRDEVLDQKFIIWNGDPSKYERRSRWQDQDLGHRALFRKCLLGFIWAHSVHGGQLSTCSPPLFCLFNDCASQPQSYPLTLDRGHMPAPAPMPDVCEPLCVALTPRSGSSELFSTEAAPGRWDYIQSSASSCVVSADFLPCVDFDHI